MRKVRAPLFPVVTPRDLNGVLNTYPLTTRQSLDGFREYGDAINAEHNATYFGGGQNEIVNGNFFINQRKVGNVAAGATGINRTADAWTMYSVGTTYASSLPDFTRGQTEVPYDPRLYHQMVVSSVAGANNLCMLYTGFQGRVTDYAQRRVCVTFWARADAARPISVEFWANYGSGGGASAAEDLEPTVIQLTTVWKKYQVFFDFPPLTGKTLAGEDDGAGITFWFDAGSNLDALSGGLGQQSGTFDIAEVVANIGEAEIIKRRPYAQEALLCRRLFYRCGGEDLYQSMGFGLALGNPTNTAYFSHFLPAPMRKSPSLTVNNIANIAITDTGPSTITPTSITMVDVLGTTQTAMTIIATVSAMSGMITGAAYLSANNSLAGSLDFSAEW